MSFLVAVLVVGAGTYLTRASFILLLANRDMPQLLQRAARNVGPAVLAALVASLLVGDRGITGLAPSIEVTSLAVAALAVWRTENVIVGLSAGMVTLWVLGAVI